MRRWKPIEGPLEHSDEWYESRIYKHDSDPPVTITASQAAAACGMSRYATPLDLFVQARRSHVPQRTPEQTVRLRRGLLFEPIFLAEYADEMGVEVNEPNRLYYHPRIPYMGATPDGIAIPNEGDEWLVEAKGTSPLMASRDEDDTGKYGETGTDQVPVEVMMQAQQQMAVCDLQRCDVVAFFGLFVMRVYPIHKNEEIIKHIAGAEQELYERICDDNPPEPTWAHPNTKGLLEELYGYRQDDSIDLDVEVADYWEADQEIAEEIKWREEKRKVLRNRILAEMEGAAVGMLPGGGELRRKQIAETVYTATDVERAREKLGTVKRRSYETLRWHKGKCI